MKTTSLGLAIATLVALAASGCTDASVASRNLSRASDQFEVTRRVVFMNGITDSTPLEIIGLCSIRDESGTAGGANQLEVTCKTGPDSYKKHYLGLSDNMTYFVEQLEPRDVSAHHYRVVFKPQAIVPDIDLRLDVEEIAATLASPINRGTGGVVSKEGAAQEQADSRGN